MRCEEPVKILEILRLTEQGFSQREIAQSVKCGKSTVGEIQKRCRNYKLQYDAATLMTNDEIKMLLYPDSFGHSIKEDPDWSSIHERLQINKRLNLQYLWEEYKADNANGLSYSRFCRRYLDWKDETGKNVIMVQNREPGKELFVDWMGDTLDCVVDISTGEILTAHFFVATLGDSSYPYVEAFPNERLYKWLLAHVNALKFLGGVPRVIVPDNCKTATTKPSYYDPAINRSYWEFARHYEVAILPARIREPQDKAPVESSVGWLETWLLEWLRGKRFFSFEALNAEIQSRVQELTKRPFQKRKGSRHSVFEALDKPALRPLPYTQFEYAEYIVRRTPANYHVEYEGFYYSVPHSLYKQMVTIRATATTIEVLNDNRERVALHQRRQTGSRYVTNLSHMPPHHRHQHNVNHFDGKKYRMWARNIGQQTYAVIDYLLSSQITEEQAYRSCMGVLQCSKKYGNERLEAACSKAITMKSCTYSTIATILKNGQDKVVASATSKPTPRHENLRGSEAYV
ncbi:IS21 family transposase [Sporomusa sp. KB1]|jgi:transposase|uniref:IS21 family transposase n=1 Tax=Sporomusa sp. KB1 TaxID=943346 RepID=UPI00119DDD64|nr:IS21 family transposase [Sporomusa sp. KB1]TWH45043.1 transposase [Sporomusa sp. KB1]